jgi:1,4-dihydroxy-2-naphthoate octaprenyltransferase
MAEHVGEFATSTESVRRALIHLRLSFSIVLTPLFIWGIYLAQPLQIPWAHMLLAYGIIHILLYGGMNAFNSYYDRDEGPIGALLEPPPVDRTVLFTALLCKAGALIGALLLDLRFGLLVAIAIVLSIAYSHPHWRWKERPIYAAICIFVGQGILGVLWGWTAASWAGVSLAWTLLIWPSGLVNTIGLLGAACWTLALYPLTGVYQIDTDSRRGIRTLAVALGVQGCFLFAAAIAPLGGLGVWAVLLARGDYAVMAVSGLYMLGAAYYTWRWYQRFATLSTRENQRALMRLANVNGLTFTFLFLALVLLGPK